MSLCKYCGAKIEWVTIKATGKPNPVEPEYVDYDDLEDDRDYLVTDGGNLIQYDPRMSYPNVRGRLSHINRCNRGLD